MSGKTDNTITVDAPMEVAWPMANDVPNWPNLFSEYKSTEILEEDGDTILFRLTMHPDEDGKVRTWVSRRTVDHEKHTAEAYRVEKGPFDYMNIRWEFTEKDGVVSMRWCQSFHVREEMPFNDTQMEEHLNRNTTIQMDVVRKNIEHAARNKGYPARLT